MKYTKPKTLLTPAHANAKIDKDKSTLNAILHLAPFTLASDSDSDKKVNTCPMANRDNSHLFDLESKTKNIAVVFNLKKGKPLPKTCFGFPVLDGDLSDNRFFDKKNHIVGLRSKGITAEDLTNECWKFCLNLSGRGKFDSVQNSRINKTRWLLDEPDTFLEQLGNEIDKLYGKAKKQGKICAVRLNGTSDIDWRYKWPKFFEEFANVKNEKFFNYEYTKVPKRGLTDKQKAKGYKQHLTYSLQYVRNLDGTKVA
tara:strand:+ start:302 stop:1066 length:765 start_codon:yes stop_codon:yes gene_type:complete